MQISVVFETMYIWPSATKLVSEISVVKSVIIIFASAVTNMQCL